MRPYGRRQISPFCCMFLTKVKTKLKEHGTDSLKKLMKRESPNGHSYEKEAALIRQYNEFKQFSYSLMIKI